MVEEKKRALIAVVRRIVFAGLILLGAWLLLNGIMEAIPSNVVELIADQSDLSLDEVRELVYESDWSTSWFSGKPVAELVGERLGDTVQLIVFGALLGLAIAAFLLFLGILISYITDSPTWLVHIRQVLRLIIVSGGVSTPIFWGATLFIVCLLVYLDWSPQEVYEGSKWWPVFFISLLPAWLLIQAGHGELSKPVNSYGLLARNLIVRFLITLLKLVGAIIVITSLMETIFYNPGLGWLMLSAVFQRDFPVVYGVAWTFILIVVFVKLAADLIEIAYNHFNRQTVLSEQSSGQESRGITIPKAWLIFCLVLIGISILFALIGPVLAPYSESEIHLADRLQGPSMQYKLGTDHLGRDILSQLLYGIRTDIMVGFMCAAIFAIVIVGWATLAAFLRKMNNWIGDTLEDVVMLPRDVACAFPWLILIVIIMSIAGLGLLQFAIIGGLVLLPHAVSMMREAYSSPPEGRGWLYSVLWSIPVMLIFAVAGGILYISSASFLGFGVPPGTPEPGAMLSQEGRKYMQIAPQLSLWPGIVLTLLSFVWVMAGDALLERLGFRSKTVWAKVVE